MPLSPKEYNTREIRAIELYCDPSSETFGNKLNSYTKAGYSNKRSSEGNAVRFYLKDKIVKGINQYREESSKKVEVTREFVIKELQSVLNDCKVDNKYIDKTNANTTLRLLGQSIAMYTDKVQSEDISDQVDKDKQGYYRQQAKQLGLKIAKGDNQTKTAE